MWRVSQRDTKWSVSQVRQRITSIDLDEELNDGHRHIEERIGREDQQELMPERRLVAVLNGIEPGAIEEIQPHDDADLGLIDEDEKDDHGYGDAPLRRCVGGKRPDAGASCFAGIKIAVGDPRDLLHSARICATA